MSALTDAVHELIEIAAGRIPVLSGPRADELHTQIDQPEPEPEPAPEPAAERAAAAPEVPADPTWAPEPADPPADPLAPQGSI